MSRIFLLLGSNVGDRKHILKAAAGRILHEIGQIESVSSVYESDAWGYSSENPFLNQLIIANTSLSPDLVLDKIHQIENQLGRKRTKNTYQDRTIDIDILFYGSRQINTPHLKVPHPSLEKRLFALYPLAELANDFVHPKTQKTMGSLLAECTDSTQVVKIKDL